MEMPTNILDFLTKANVVTRTSIFLFLSFSNFISITHDTTPVVLQGATLIFSMGMIIWIIYFDITQNKKNRECKEVRKIVKEFTSQFANAQISRNEECFGVMKKFLLEITNDIKDQKKAKEIKNKLVNLLESIEKSIGEWETKMNDWKRAGNWLEENFEFLTNKITTHILNKREYQYLRNEEDNFRKSILQHVHWVVDNLKNIDKYTGYTELNIETPTTYMTSTPQVYRATLEHLREEINKKCANDLPSVSQDALFGLLDTLISHYSSNKPFP